MSVRLLTCYNSKRIKFGKERYVSAQCPFCGFEASDFRESYNWYCTKCGNDYANWLLAQKTSTSSQEDTQEKAADKKAAFFSRREIPLEAEPVKFAESLIVLGMLMLLALNFVIEGIFSWIYPISIPLVGYYALTIYRTGYALGKHEVYHRDRNPIIYRCYLLGSIGYIFVALFAWID